MTFDPYAVLEVHPAAEHQIIKVAYRALARRFHPDVASSVFARRRMVDINRAWELVSDPTRRADLDKSLRERRRGASAGTSPGPSGAPGRTGQPPPKGWGAGAKGPPPGRPSGTVLEFGIYLHWSLGEVLRVDPMYLDWLTDRHEGRPYHDEIETLRGRSATSGRPGRRFGA
jgi:curved DNA-binding protein CbpA